MITAAAALAVPSFREIGFLPIVQESGLAVRSAQANPPAPTGTPGLTEGGISAQEAGFLAQHELIRGDSDRNVVMLTYDDARDGDGLHHLMDVYRENGVHTTFFIVGTDLEKCSQAIPRIVAEGHELGCHGWIHEPMTSFSDRDLDDQFRAYLAVVRQIVPSYRVRFFRAPYGERNERLRQIAANWGMQHVLWSLESGGQEKITFHNVVDRVQPGEIVLSHETRYFDVNDADVIVREIIRKGYSLENVSTGMAPADRWTAA